MKDICTVCGLTLDKCPAKLRQMNPLFIDPFEPAYHDTRSGHLVSFMPKDLDELEQEVDSMPHADLVAKEKQGVSMPDFLTHLAIKRDEALAAKQQEELYDHLNLQEELEMQPDGAQEWHDFDPDC